MLASQTQTHGPVVRRNSLAAVTIIFVLMFALLQTVLWLLAFAGQLDWLMEGTAAITSALVDWAGIPVTLAGKQLIMANHLLQIDLDCTGVTIAALYAAMIVAYPLSPRTRLLALAVGLPVIAVANLLRLIGVALASEYLSADVFSFAHDYLFKVMMILVVVGLWAAWLQVARTHAAKA